MTKPPLTGATVVAGVVGSPVRHSLSPLIHNAWLDAAGIDGVYAPFPVVEARFPTLLEGLRGGAVRGLNVTLPFKELALSAADRPTHRAKAAAAANLLVFEEDGTIFADNTDGIGLLGAFAAQVPDFDPQAGAVVVLGAGGAARGAVAAFVDAGASEVRIVNRTQSRGEALARSMTGPVVAHPWDSAASAFEDAIAVINATSAGLSGEGVLEMPLEATPPEAVVMDMVYKPLRTPFLQRAAKLGRRTVDGLEMLIRQARPSFEAFYGAAPPAEADVRRLALQALGETD